MQPPDGNKRGTNSMTEQNYKVLARKYLFVIPAKAGIQRIADAMLKEPFPPQTRHCWIPAFAGMTKKGR